MGLSVQYSAHEGVEGAGGFPGEAILKRAGIGYIGLTLMGCVVDALVAQLMIYHEMWLETLGGCSLNRSPRVLT